MCRFILFTIFVISCSVIGIQAQPCIPEPVETIDLAKNGTLTWSASDNCAKTQYNVIIQTQGVVEYEYTVDSLALNLNFLKYCRPYTFSVAPVADHILGEENSLESAIPLPDNVNITILYFNGSQVGNDALVQWHVNENYTYCVTYYHLQVSNEESKEPESFYIGDTGHLVEHVAQCMLYTFTVEVYYANRSSAPKHFNFTIPEQPNNPSLIELRQDTTVINSTWRLEPFTLNRCNVTSLIINSAHFNKTYPIVDEPDRPDVLVSITGLKANTLYYFNVLTNSTAGLSDPFQIAVQTLPTSTSFD